MSALEGDSIRQIWLGTAGFDLKEELVKRLRELDPELDLTQQFLQECQLPPPLAAVKTGPSFLDNFQDEEEPENSKPKEWYELYHPEDTRSPVDGEESEDKTSDSEDEDDESSSKLLSWFEWPVAKLAHSSPAAWKSKF